MQPELGRADSRGRLAQGKRVWKRRRVRTIMTQATMIYREVAVSLMTAIASSDEDVPCGAGGSGRSERRGRGRGRRFEGHGTSARGIID